MEHVELEELPRELNAALEQFRIRNLWHGFVPMSLSEWVYEKHGNTFLL